MIGGVGTHVALALMVNPVARGNHLRYLSCMPPRNDSHFPKKADGGDVYNGLSMASDGTVRATCFVLRHGKRTIGFVRSLL